MRYENGVVEKKQQLKKYIIKWHRRAETTHWKSVGVLWQWENNNCLLVVFFFILSHATVMFFFLHSFSFPFGFFFLSFQSYSLGFIIKYLPIVWLGVGMVRYDGYSAFAYMIHVSGSLFLFIFTVNKKLWRIEMNYFIFYNSSCTYYCVWICHRVYMHYKNWMSSRRLCLTSNFFFLHLEIRI